MKSDKYSRYKFFIEKQITIKDTPNIKRLALKNVFVYVIREPLHNIGFCYVTSKKLGVGTQILGKQLEFYHTNFNEPTKFKFIKTLTKTKLIQLDIDNPINKQNINKKYTILKSSKFQIVLRTLFYKKVFDEIDEDKKSEYFLNKLAIHTKRIATDKYLWFIDNIINIKNPQKKLLNHILNKAIVDTKIKNILISELINFKSNKYMHLETHSIILTQGGTGKSSILGIMGKNLDDTSNAGIFGSYDVKRSQWNSGIVSQTDYPILVDETNELISSGKSILETLNKPLDNGSYYYGKAGSRNIEFGNQFIFLGNISEEFNFERFINGLSNNILTIGRRFSYIIYDTKLNFINGNIRPKKRTDFINQFTELLTYTFYILIETKGFISLINSNYYKKLLIPIKRYILNECKYIEHIGTKHFFTEYIKSLDGRVPYLVLKLVVFDELKYILNKNIIDTPKYYIADKFNKKCKIILNDIKETFDNIISHQKNSVIIDIKTNKIKQKLSYFTKSSNYCLELVILNITGFNKNKLMYPVAKGERILKQKVKDIIKNCKRYQKTILKINCDLQKVGLKFIITNNEKYFTITNKKIFSDIIEYYSQLDNNNIPKNKQNTKENINITDLEIDTFDLT